MGSFEIIEHTADVGILARADTLEGLFEQATLGLLDIMGALAGDQGSPEDADGVPIDIEALDVGGLLVDWLNEVLYVQEARDGVFTSVQIEDVSEERVRATLWVRARTETLEGTPVKAATFHRLEVTEREDGWTATVYVDV